MVHTLRGFQHYQLWKKLFKPKEKYSIATIICKRATYNFDVVWTKFKRIQCTTEIKSQVKGLLYVKVYATWKTLEKSLQVLHLKSVRIFSILGHPCPWFMNTTLLFVYLTKSICYGFLKTNVRFYRCKRAESGHHELCPYNPTTSLLFQDTWRTISNASIFYKITSI